ncbi:unnamed protein product [Paramecium sonneborni]|uniref:Uncharacterized protein n=1 Tax=Paramecium sonneborni TaxID=65129 RepID=A0A8S1RJ21_9CILI|nr:unnamed protein product [Paramecium sonneborni]
MIEQRDYQIKQQYQVNQSSTLKIQIPFQQIENQDKYIIRLKQQELKYIKLLGTISEYLQKIIGQIQQKLDRKQKQQQEKEKSSAEFLTRQIQQITDIQQFKYKQISRLEKEVVVFDYFVSFLILNTFNKQIEFQKLNAQKKAALQNQHLNIIYKLTIG